MRKSIYLAVVMLFAAAPVKAQFTVFGNEKPSVRWNTFPTENYRFIYPKGCDSIASRYAIEWEKACTAVAFDSPGKTLHHRLPVILHPYSATSNGFVVWAPSRMEMYMTPFMYDPEPLPWQTLLAIHEGRHVRQMQFMYGKHFNWLNYIFGELAAGPLCTIFNSSVYMEGDAVAAETMLSQAGRGRSADFMQYMRVCFENADIRSYDRWRYGSQKLYAPDYYKVGYLACAGLGMEPTAEMLSRPFRKTFKSYADSLGAMWRVETASRAPFQPYVRLTDDRQYYTVYKGLCVMDGDIYGVRSSIAENSRLFKLEMSTKSLHLLDYTVAESKLDAGDGVLYWSEERPDIRWEMHSTSELRALQNGHFKRLVKGEKVFNPAYGNGLVAYVKANVDGSYTVNVNQSDTFESEIVYNAPDGLQPIEPVWVGDELYVSGLTDDGEGIFNVKQKFTSVLAPSYVKINHLRSDNVNIYFTSDRSGVNEMYQFCLHNGEVYQMTNLPQGGRDFVFCNDTLYFTVDSPRGRNICATAGSDLPVRKVDFTQRASWPIADSLVSRNGVQMPENVNQSDTLCGIVPAPYRKFSPKSLRLYGWAPVWMDWDELATGSMETLENEAGLGASVFFQNDLNSFYGNAGVRLATPLDGWSPNVNLSLTYRGIYPVVETRADVSAERVYGRVRTYVPLNLSSDGWSRGVVPVATVEVLKPFNMNGFMYAYNVGVRAYSVLPRASSCVYPRWGLGGEVGMTSLKPYATLYGYLPGFRQAQGFALRATYNGLLDMYGAQVEYGMPVLPIDWDRLAPFTYVKNFELKPFYSYYVSQIAPQGEHRVGASFAAVLGNLWFLTTTFRVGLKVSYGNVAGTMCNLVFSYDM